MTADSNIWCSSNDNTIALLGHLASPRLRKRQFNLGLCTSSPSFFFQACTETANHFLPSLCQQLSYFWRTSLIHFNGFPTSVLLPGFGPPGLLLYLLHSKTKLKLSVRVSCNENKEAGKNSVINAHSHGHTLSVHPCGSCFTLVTAVCGLEVTSPLLFLWALFLNIGDSSKTATHTTHIHPTPNTNQVLL